MPDEFVTPFPLGRVKSEPDPRNWQMSTFLAVDAAPPRLQVLMAAVAKHYYSRDLLAWCQEVTDILAPLPAPAPPPTLRAKRWECRTELDQGDTPHCVGFGWTHHLNADPTPHTLDATFAHSVYYDAKVLDGEPKAEDGTSVHSGAKAIRSRGYIDGYAWAADWSVIDQWLLAKGPVVIGTIWTDRMFDVDAQGFLHYAEGDNVVGGHCYIVDEVDLDAGFYGCLNNWRNRDGSPWGVQNRFRIPRDDMHALFGHDSDGECCTAVEVK